jgi:iron complex transport system substrate-binding protein
MMKNIITWTLLFALLGLFGSCGKGKAASPTESAQPVASSNIAEASGTNRTVYPVSVENYTPGETYGEGWSGKTQTFTQSPVRAVVTTQTVAELLLRLGLVDKIAGVCGVFDTIAADLADDFARLNIITVNYASKELVVGANPDVVIGRGGLFANADWGCGTVDDLNDMGIKTFVLNASRPDATIDDLYRDIAELGEIFDAREKADALIAETRANFAAVTAKLAGETPKTYGWVWGVSDGAVSIYSANTENFINGTLEEIKLVNAFGNVSGDVSMEQIVAANPDILITVDAELTGDNLESLYSLEALQSVNAIKNRQVYIVDYNEFWGYGYQLFAGMEKLADAVFGK